MAVRELWVEALSYRLPRRVAAIGLVEDEYLMEEYLIAVLASSCHQVVAVGTFSRTLEVLKGQV